jgi:hypothetical protein
MGLDWIEDKIINRMKRQRKDGEEEPYMLGRPACPFYGVNKISGVMKDSWVNQCAIIIKPYSPCQVKVVKDGLRWFGCPFTKEKNRKKIAEDLEKIEGSRPTKTKQRRIHLTVKSTPKKYPILCTSMPYCFTINHKERVYKRREELVAGIAEYLVDNPYDLIVFRNKLPKKEKVLREVLEDRIKGHNLTLKFGVGRHRCLRRIRKVLREAGE